MKKGLICLVLVLLMVMPAVLSGCQQETDIEETAANVYTLYTIVEKSTTPEAITKVELALNRILFYRLGYCVKLVMVTEDEYDKLIEEQFEVMEAYQVAKKDKNKNDKNKNETSAESSEDETSEVIMTGDRILDMLDEGQEIELENPRLDIFLVRGYDKYYEYATQDKLTAIDEKLNNEAKALKSSIHSTLLTAAKVGNKTYGVPVNNAIGQYSYIVFDKELLEKYSVDPNTLKTIEDLEDYLAVIKANEPDVVPLKQSDSYTKIDFLCNEGTPFVVNSAGEVVDAYSNKEVTAYFSMLARYNHLGYFENDGSEEPRYAVRIEEGSIDEITAMHKDEGYELEFSLFSNPIATNENTIDNIFCISKYVVSNELTDVMKIVTALNTDSDLMNILTYGVENEHYIINDGGQIERLNNDYIINPEYAGNTFITNTLATESKDKWQQAIQQNQDATASKSLGFTLVLETFSYTEKETLQTTDSEGNTVEIEAEIEKEISEPDYLAIINTVVDKYYPAIIKGNAVEIDFDVLYKQAEEEITQKFTEKIDKIYRENILNPMYRQRIESSVIANRSAAIKQQAEKAILADYFSVTKRKLKNKLTAQLKEEMPDASSDEISEKVSEILTDEYINERIYEENDEEDILADIEDMFEYILNDEINEAINNASGTAAYENEFLKLKASAQYKKDLNDMLTYDAPSEIANRYSELISEAISEYTDNMKAEMDKAIEEAITAFVEEYKDILQMTDNEILEKIGFMEEVKQEASEEEADESKDTEEGEEGEEEVEIVYEQAYESYFDFVFQVKFVNAYYKIFGTPDGN